MVDDVDISTRQLVVIMVTAMLAYTTMCLVIAERIFFPIPFMSITMTLPYLILLAFLFYFVVGGRLVRKILQHKRQLFRFAVFLAAQTLMSVIYPAYQILFRVASDSGYELLAVALLPAMKIIMKNIVSLSFQLMPEGVIFTVDFFNAFYIATSMQNASSPTTVVVIMVTDVVNTALALNGFRKGISNLQHLTTDSGGLLNAACSLCRSSNEFEFQTRAGIQLRSCIAYGMSPANKAFIDHLSKYSGYQPHTRSSISCASGRFFSQTTVQASIMEDYSRRHQRWCLGKRRAMVEPIVVSSAKSRETGSKVDTFTRTLSLRRSELREILQLLFTCECLVLSEYFPILYANYIMVMVHLPSCQYHLEMTGLTSDNVDGKVQLVLAYALLEFSSFLVMAIFVQRKRGIKILHHLAFVLETHMPLIQDKLMAWTLLTLAARVIHFGADFTFQFAWVKS